MTSKTSQEAISQLRVRNFVDGTQRDYLRAVKKLAAFLGRSPDTATAEDLRAFQKHLAAGLANPPSINITVSALRFFFRVTVDKPETTRHLVRVYETAEASARVVARGSSPFARGSNDPKGLGGAERRLWRRPACHGGGEAQSFRHRLKAHADPR